jgi:hypothetical protein
MRLRSCYECVACMVARIRTGLSSIIVLFGVAIGETFGGVESPELVDCNYFSPVLSILPPSVTGNQIRGKKRLIRTKVGAMTLERQLH